MKADADLLGCRYRPEARLPGLSRSGTINFTVIPAPRAILRAVLSGASPE